MYEFLLSRANVLTLERYSAFLLKLADPIKQLQVHEWQLRTRGHCVVPLADVNQLTRSALHSAGSIGRIEAIAHDLSEFVSRALNDLAVVALDVREIIRGAPDKGRTMTVGAIDFQRTRMAKLNWMGLPKTGKSFYLFIVLRFLNISPMLGDLRSIPKELLDGIYNVFENFSRSLTLPPCHCHRCCSRIQVFYRQGGLLSSDFLNVPLPDHTAASRSASARAYLCELRHLKKEAASAIHNLGDFVFAIRLFLTKAEEEILTINENMTLARLNRVLAFVEDYLGEMESMVYRLQKGFLR